MGLAWQIDSREWHLDPEGYAETLWRRSLLQRRGALVVSTLPRALADDRRAVVQELTAMRAMAAALPRPALQVVPA